MAMIRSGLRYLTRRLPWKSHQTLWQTLRKLARAESSEGVEMLQCRREYRRKAEFVRVESSVLCGAETE